MPGTRTGESTRNRADLANAGLVLLSIACGGCNGSSAVLSDARPVVFRYGYSSSLEENDRQFRRLNVLRDYLAKELRVPVEVVKGGGYGVTIEALRARKLEASTMGPFSYLIAAERANVEPLVTMGFPDGTPGAYNSIIVVPSSSPIRTIQDLKAKASGLTFTFCNPASTSGHLVPRAYLESIGVDVEKAFKRILFSQNHLVTALTVSQKKVDAGATMESIIARLVKTGKIKGDELRVIWKSPPIVRSPVVIRKDLPAAFRKEVKQAFLQMPQRSPELWNVMQSVMMAPGQVYVSVNDGMFDELRQVAKRMKNVHLMDE